MPRVKHDSSNQFMLPGFADKFVIVALGRHAGIPHVFTVARILGTPADLQHVKVQWYQAVEEFGEYKPCVDQQGKPDTAELSSDTFVTPPFDNLEHSGHLPVDVENEVNEHMDELELL